MKKSITVLNLPVEDYIDKDILQKILDGLSFEFDVFTLDETIDLDTLNRYIVGSDLIVIPGPRCFSYYGTRLKEMVFDYYSKGGCIFYDIYPVDFAIQNEFLEKFEMKNSGIRLRARTGADILFASTPHSFRDRYFFQDIDGIVLSQPNHTEYWGNSIPILKGNGNFISISENDLPVNFDSKEITPIVMAENDQHGMMISINGAILLTDQIHRDDSENNFNFFVNLYNFALSRRKSRYELYSGDFRMVEQLLAKFVLNRMKEKFGDNWYMRIPDAVLKMAEQRAGRGGDIESNLSRLERSFDFIHYKKIISANWEIFKELMDVDEKNLKAKSLKWMDTLNEKRKPTFHSSKDPLDKEITYDDISFLRECKCRLEEISKKYQNGN